MTKYNIRILKYSTNTWITDAKGIIEALKDIINGSNDYSYNKSMAEHTLNLIN